VGNVATIITAPDAPVSLAENTVQRTATTLGLQWNEGASNGGSSVTEYRINYAQQGGSYSVLASTANTYYEVTSLTSGTTYEFKIEANNEYGYSTYSSTLSLLAAYIPAVPISVTTQIDGNTVKVSWSLSTTNGSPITAYKVFVKQSGSSIYTLEAGDCDGTDATVISNSYCNINFSSLITSPFNIVGGDSIHAKVVAGNIYGDSAQSTSGNGAIYTTVPDAPISIAED
jgi:hypothetical protein